MNNFVMDSELQILNNKIEKITESLFEIKLLKEHLEGIEKLDKVEKGYLKEALDKSAKEYERRLDELNHSAERATIKEAKFVLNDVYNVQHKKLEDKDSDLDKKIDKGNDACNSEIKKVSKLVYIGVGIALAVEFLSTIGIVLIMKVFAK